MTPLETLAKYGLKSDVKSIHERMNKFDLYYQVGKKAFPDTQVGEQFGVVLEIVDADKEVICSLAEKGERYETYIKKRIDHLENRNKATYTDYIIGELHRCIIISEAEGEGK